MAGLPRSSPVLLAYSGGADSRALLHLLAGECRELGATLVCAHVNHGIRGDEALRDRDFCLRSAAGYGVECIVLDADVPALAKEHKQSLETEAREVRYQFFEKIMRERNIPILVTAHNADDRLETMIFNIARGCGLNGLISIPEIRPFGPGFLVRPLLGAKKNEILGFCRENNLEYVTDSTNYDTDYSRNLIRHKIIPLLEELNSGVRDNAARLSAAAAEACDLISLESDEALADFDRDVPISALAKLHPALKAAALARLCERAGAKSPETVHLNALSRLIDEGREGSALSLPGKIRARISEGFLVFTPDTREKIIIPRPDFKVTLTAGINRIPGGAILLTPPGENGEVPPGMRESGRITLDTHGLFVRGLQEGDGIKYHAMTKKVRRLLAEAKIPPTERYTYPIVCDSAGIVWIPGVAIRDGALSQSGGTLIYYKEEKATERQR